MFSVREGAINTRRGKGCKAGMEGFSWVGKKNYPPAVEKYILTRTESLPDLDLKLLQFCVSFKHERQELYRIYLKVYIWVDNRLSGQLTYEKDNTILEKY